MCVKLIFYYTFKHNVVSRDNYLQFFDIIIFDRVFVLLMKCLKMGVLYIKVDVFFILFFCRLGSITVVRSVGALKLVVNQYVKNVFFSIPLTRAQKPSISISREREHYAAFGCPKKHT